jgi:tRNA threonylcarbamoyladenosine modification (KEOPS) complex  Pcc1 subunit
MNESILSLKVPSDAASACLNSIKPEIDSDVHGRSIVELRADGEGLLLRITANDLHAMRAGVNTYVRWLDMCLKLAK